MPLVPKRPLSELTSEHEVSSNAHDHLTPPEFNPGIKAKVTLEVLAERASELGINPGDLLTLQSATARKKLELMAASPSLWGLSLWISGSEFFLLDKQGLVAVTQEEGIALSLCNFESRMGPGSTRELLKVPVIDPMAAVTALDPRFTTRYKHVEERHRTSAPKAPRVVPKIKPSLDPTVLASLLSDL